MSNTPATLLKNSVKVWKLGKHRLIQGDATKKEDLTKLIGQEKIALVLTDPPYGVGYVEGKQEFLKTIQRDGKGKEFSAIQGDGVDADYYKFSTKWLEVVKPHLKNKNSFYW